MRTAKPRWEDGKSGTSSAKTGATSASGIRGKPFPKGPDNPSTGRKKGSRNKLLAQIEELKALPGVPEDPLAFLAYVQMNPRNVPWINWDLRTRAASERAKYMYARKTETKSDAGPKSMRIIVEGYTPSTQAPAPDPQPFHEPAKPRPALAPQIETPPAEPETPRETAKTTGEDRLTDVDLETLRRENRRVEFPPEARETPYQAETRRQEERRRDRKSYGPTLPPIAIR